MAKTATAVVLALGLFGLGTAHAQTAPTTKKPPIRSQVVVQANATTAATVPTGILYSWSYVPNAPQCPANSVLANCWSGFTATITYGSNVVTIPNVTLPPGTLSYSWIPSGGLPYATYNMSLVANGYDTNGKLLTSTPATTTTVNGLTSLNGPTGLTGVNQ